MTTIKDVKHDLHRFCNNKFYETPNLNFTELSRILFDICDQIEVTQDKLLLSEKEKDQSVNPSPRKEPLAFAYKSNKYQPTDHEQHIENLQKEIVKLYNQMESISYKDIVTMNLRSWGFFEAIKHWLKVKK